MRIAQAVALLFVLDRRGREAILIVRWSVGLFWPAFEGRAGSLHLLDTLDASHEVVRNEGWHADHAHLLRYN